MSENHLHPASGIASVEVLSKQTAAPEISLAPGLRRIRLESFEEPYKMPAEELASYRRRFVTLFADDARTRRGGLGMVVHVSNAMGESYALKVLVEPERIELESDESHRARVGASRAAFRAEYESHRAVSGFKGFPRLYGYATVDGRPAIVMEWVEGVTLAQARDELSVDGDGRLAPLAAARIGRDLFALLTRLDLVGEGFVHRDISPANVLVRTGHLSLMEQDAEGAFDLCLIDFGSSVALDPVQDPAYTQRYAMLRCATPGYAPPEMLTADLPGLAGLRKSPKIDIYAAASVVFELMSGMQPFDTSASREQSLYRTKMDEAPRKIESAHATAPDLASVLVREPEVALAAGQASLDLSIDPDSDELRRALALVDGQAQEIIVACLAPRQEERPSAQAVRDGLSAFCSRYAQNAERALRGEPLLPCTDEPSWFDSASPYKANRLVSAIGNAASLAVLIMVVLMTAVLLDDVPAKVVLGPVSWRIHLSAAWVAAALALPAVAGILARGRMGGTKEGFLRGTVALAVATIAALLGASRVDPIGITGAGPLVSAVFAAAAAGWCPLVLEYAMTVVPALIVESRRALPEGREAGADAALQGACDEGGATPTSMLGEVSSALDAFAPSGEITQGLEDGCAHAGDGEEKTTALMPDDDEREMRDGRGCTLPMRSPVAADEGRARDVVDECE